MKELRKDGHWTMALLILATASEADGRRAASVSAYWSVIMSSALRITPSG